MTHSPNTAAVVPSLTGASFSPRASLLDVELANRAFLRCREAATLSFSNQDAEWYSTAVDAMQEVYARAPKGVLASTLPVPELARVCERSFLDSVRVRLLEPGVTYEFPWRALTIQAPSVRSSVNSLSRSSELALRDAYFLPLTKANDPVAHVRMLAEIAQWRILGDKGYAYAFVADRALAKGASPRLKGLSDRVAERLAASGFKDISLVAEVKNELHNAFPA